MGAGIYNFGRRGGGLSWAECYFLFFSFSLLSAHSLNSLDARGM